MLLSKAEHELSTRWVESKPEKPPKGHEPFPPAIRKRILNSTIRLVGGGFNGSGVIFNVKPGSVSIVTAAHNAMVFKKIKKPPQNWNNDALTGDRGFKNKVKIWYGSDDLTFNSKLEKLADIETVEVPTPTDGCDGRQNCLYDLMIITSKEPKLLRYAVEKVFGGTWSDDANTLKGEIDKINTAVKAEATLVKDQPNSFLSRKKYWFVQLGCGEIQEVNLDRRKKQSIVDEKIVEEFVDKGQCGGGFDVSAQRLQYRWTYPHSQKIASMFDQSGEATEAEAYAESSNAISITGSRSSSSAPGDSGGPLYAIDKGYAGAYLIGVNCGADMKPGKKICLPYTNCVAVSVAPYWKSKFNTEFP